MTRPTESSRRTPHPACADGKPFRSVLEADVRVSLTADQLDDAFGLDRALRNTASTFAATEEVE